MEIKISGSIEERYVCFFSKTESVGAGQLDVSYDRPGTWFINRLFVPPKLRGQGIATALLNAVTSWADDNKFKLMLGINPYGDLQQKQLLSFYQKYGFIASVDQPELFIRP